MCALKNVKEVELMGMPKLKKCVLMGGLKNVKSVKMENAGKLESVKGLKEVMEEERKKREEAERKRREEAERKRREEAERKRREEAERKRREEAERKRREEAERKKREEAERKRREEAERKRREEAERKRREEEERKKREEMIALAKGVVNVQCMGDLKNANASVRTVVITSNCCNDSELNMLDLSRFVNLRELKVGDECFENVKEVKLIGLSQLERVVIGWNSFNKNGCGNDPNRHFYLKNCERLRELKMGRRSFSDYSVCEIEKVPSLEVIEMGDLDIIGSGSFFYASLELKSDSERMK